MNPIFILASILIFEYSAKNIIANAGGIAITKSPEILEYYIKKVGFLRYPRNIFAIFSIIGLIIYDFGWQNNVIILISLSFIAIYILIYIKNCLSAWRRCKRMSADAELGPDRAHDL